MIIRKTQNPLEIIFLR